MRSVAILLLALFGFSLIAPAFESGGAESKLPACCRRNGMHHCAMTRAVSGSGVRVAANAPACPLYRQFTIVAGAKHYTIPRVATLSPLSVAAHASLRFHSSLTRRGLLAGANRGPPVFL